MDKMILLLLPLLATVESGGDPNAVGDGGAARGLYQIHRGYWSDGCRELKVQWPYRDAVRPDRARQVVIGYLKRYGRHYEKSTGRKATLETLGRIHNGGPTGWKKKSTRKYWQKIKKYLKNEYPSGFV